MSDPEKLLGTTIGAGRYAVSAVLGAGSQGTTLEAVDKRDGRLVAIKRFEVRGARSWKDVELAEREAEVLARLHHRLLPEALDHFEEDGALFLVMEKIEGASLAGGVASRREVIAFLSDAAEVLDYLHRQSPPVIHRDIKPGNVVKRPASADERASYVLVDFGSVRQRLEPRGGSTVVGTFGYMAPEQLQGRAMPATDVYAVGATALRLLTGVEPEDLPHEGLRVDVRAALGGRDRDLAAILERMLEPDPDRRASRIGPLLEGLESEAAPDGRPRDRPRKQRREGRARRRDARRERRRERAERHDRDFPPAIVAALFVPAVAVGLGVARVAVVVALRIVVPLVLALLAVIFGESLRRAAATVDEAGKRADRAIVRARERAFAGGPRIEPASPEPPKTRFERIEEPIDAAADEVEAALEQAAEELEDALARAAKKPRR